MFVVRAGSISHWGCWLIRLIVKMRDPRMHRCVACTIAILILEGFPVNVRRCIKIRDTHVQNAISLMFQRFLVSRSPRSSVGVDIRHLRYDLGIFVVRRGQKMGCELWRQGLEAQT